MLSVPTTTVGCGGGRDPAGGSQRPASREERSIAARNSSGSFKTVEGSYYRCCDRDRPNGHMRAGCLLPDHTPTRLGWGRGREEGRGGEAEHGLNCAAFFPAAVLHQQRANFLPSISVAENSTCKYLQNGATTYREHGLLGWRSLRYGACRRMLIGVFMCSSCRASREGKIAYRPHVT